MARGHRPQEQAPGDHPCVTVYLAATGWVHFGRRDHERHFGGWEGLAGALIAPEVGANVDLSPPDTALGDRCSVTAYAAELQKVFDFLPEQAPNLVEPLRGGRTIEQSD